jgi:ribosome-associated translation inhibitor RaiA
MARQASRLAEAAKDDADPVAAVWRRALGRLPPARRYRNTRNAGRPADTLQVEAIPMAPTLFLLLFQNNSILCVAPIQARGAGVEVTAELQKRLSSRLASAGWPHRSLEPGCSEVLYTDLSRGEPGDMMSAFRRSSRSRVEMRVYSEGRGVVWSSDVVEAPTPESAIDRAVAKLVRAATKSRDRTGVWFDSPSRSPRPCWLGRTAGPSCPDAAEAATDRARRAGWTSARSNPFGRAEHAGRPWFPAMRPRA